MKKSRILFLIVVVILCVLIYFQFNVTNILLNLSEATIRSQTAVAVNNAVFAVMGNGSSYSDLVNVTYDDSGNVTQMSANTFKVNSLARSTAYMSQENLSTMLRSGIRVPCGAFTGMELFAGFGQEISLKIIPVSTVDSTFYSTFTSAGINQTLHSLYIDVVTTVDIVLPTKSRVVKSESQILIAESIIVGRIPETYLSGSLFR